MKHQPKLDPLSKASLVAWLITQPAEREYSYMSPFHCLLGQWTRSIDPAAHFRADHGGFCYEVNGEVVNLSHFSRIAGGPEQNWTFGAALERASA